MLALTERAAEDGVQVVVYPRVPGLNAGSSLLTAFYRNVEERAPGVSWVRPGLRYQGGEMAAHATALGRTVVLEGDDCVDPALFPRVQALDADALVWLFTGEDALQSEAALELALEASQTLSPLVVIAAVTGAARGVQAHGTAAIVRLGEIVGEGGEGEDLVIAEIPAASGMPERPRRFPEPAPVLVQRLSAHRGVKAPAPYPADLS